MLLDISTKGNQFELTGDQRFLTKRKSDVLRHVHSSSSSHDQLVTPSPLMDAGFTAFAASKGS